DDRQSGLGLPGREILSLDEHGFLGDPALELGLRADDLDAPRRACFFLSLSAAATMFGTAPQRQRLPLTARNTSSVVGDGLRLRSPTHDMIWPGVQNPHWKASCSMKPSWTGWSPRSVDKPSMVSTARPAHATASVRHEYTGSR